MTQRPALRSATPEVAVAVPRPRPPVEAAPAEPPRRGPILGGSVLGGRSILAGPSIFAARPVAPVAARLPAAPARHRRPSRNVVVRSARGVGRVARSGGRSVATWAGRPSGRFVVPLVAIVGVLALTGAVGNFATRAGAPAPHPGASASPSASGAAPAGGDQVLPNPDSTQDSGAVPPAHPQDVVAQWAHRLGPKVGIADTALIAYGYATLREAADAPTCHLSWTTLAGIGKVESSHGTENHATLHPDGFALPPIIGPALNGQGGNDTVPDSDGGQYDGDRVYDHAIGPMQFLPSTWQRYQIDADEDGRADPNDLNDAALAAARYLCAGGLDLATDGGWWGAVESYNKPVSYAQRVFDAANDYGQKSHSVA